MKVLHLLSISLLLYLPATLPSLILSLPKNAKNWFKNGNRKPKEFGLYKMDISLIKRKQWTVVKNYDNISSKDRKVVPVVPRKELHTMLCQSHLSIAHRRRDKLEHFIKRSHAEVSLIKFFHLSVWCLFELRVVPFQVNMVTDLISLSTFF